MKPKNQIRLFALLLATFPLGIFAQTTFFTDTFTTSTTNGISVRTGPPAASVTSYDIAASKNTDPGTTIAQSDLHLALGASTSSGFLEAQALFATNSSTKAFQLNQANDYIDVMVVFTNTTATLFSSGSAPIWLGLYNSGGSAPLTNLFNSGLSSTANSVEATNGAAGWVGYIASVNLDGGTSRITTRPSQVTGTSSADQDLVAGTFSSSGFSAVSPTTLSTGPATTANLSQTAASTIDLRITLVSPGTLMISNYLYDGVGTSGTVVYATGNNNVTGANILATTFDSLCIGVSGKGVLPVMDVSSITITGISSAPSLPTITAQPVPVVCATNGSCQFSVTAVGTGLAYQWYRNNVSLSNVGEFSGATSSQLLISPAQSSDAANYYCSITGVGGATNSVTNALVLVPVTNLIWTASSGATWDLANTPSWETASSIPQTFNEGDNVRFDDTPNASQFISLAGGFLSPASITIDSESGYAYTFTTTSGAGTIGGTGSMLYQGKGQLNLNEANTFSGGVLVSNSLSSPDSGQTYVYLENYAALGTGPVVLDDENATMEIVPSGGAAAGIAGNVDVLSDYTIQVDANGTYAAVLLGNLSGTVGKTLTINPETAGSTNRIRVDGTSTVFNGNLALDTQPSDSTISQAIFNGTVLAPYEPSGIQIYNGTISGYGGIVQRGAGTAVLNGQNTYSGGTYPAQGTLALGVDSIPTTGTSITSGPIGTGPMYISPEIGTTTGSGTVLATNGSRTIGNAIEYPTGTNNQTLVIGGTNNLTFTGPVSLNGIDGTTSPLYPSRIFNITSSGATTFAGSISDSSTYFALTKNGAGSLYLNGVNTFLGTITNSSSGTTNMPGLLAGTGTIAGSVVVLTNSAIGGGSASAIGTLTINGNLTLTNGNGWFRVNRAGLASDKVSVGTTITNYGTGTISVTNLGAALQPGDTFTLFSQPVTGGGTLNVVGSGMVWQNKLAVNGTIVAQSVIVTSPPYLTNVLNGSTLTLSWGAGYAGYTLQAQTNALTVGLTTNHWVDVPNSSNVTKTNITIVPGNPTVFYRLSQNP